MFKVDLGHVITEMIEELYRPSPEIKYVKSGEDYVQQALLLTFKISMGRNTSFRLSVLAFGNCSIFFATSPVTTQTKDLKWENTCNHVSEWRNSGITQPLRDIFFAKCKEVDDTVAPAYIENDVRFGFGLPFSRTVMAKWRYVEEERYLKEIISIEDYQ